MDEHLREPSDGSSGASAPAPLGEDAAPKCPYCLAAIAAGEETHTCPSCHSVYHHECWTENGGCAVYGCAQVPVVESRRAIEVPLSYWGQENKPCPACGQQILAAAVRCRHCGATFGSARPQDAGEFQSRAALAARMPEAQKRVVMIFVLSIIPFTAPIAAIWAWIWRSSHGKELAALPPLHAALHKIGLFVAIGLTIALGVMTALYVVVRGN
jgi:hypothetical protein